MKKRWIVLILVLALLAALAAGVYFLYIRPYQLAESHMAPGGTLVLQQRSDGSVELSWPQAQADYYRVSIHSPEPDSEGALPVLHQVDVMQGTSYQLPQLYDETVVLQVNTMVRYRQLGQVKLRPGDSPLQARLSLTPPEAAQLQWTADPDSDTLELSFRLTEGDIASLYAIDELGQRTLLQTMTMSDTALVTFGEGKLLPMPSHGQHHTLVIAVAREHTGFRYQGRDSQPITVIREDLLGDRLLVELADQGQNRYTLTWNETKGERYLVQMTPGGYLDWENLAVVEQDGNRSYTTGHLPAYTAYDFRVVAEGGQTMPGSNVAAMSTNVSVQTGASVIYSTVWPGKKLSVYAQPGDESPIGSVAAGSMHCVLAEEGDLFCIRYGDGTGWIDSRHCLINLPEYLGDICAYQITNSYSSEFMVHKYEIPEVTGERVVGYESVRLADGSFLVPLLYPTAKKLAVAALDALQRGYRLKIYDAYRPNRATVAVYDITEQLLAEPVPGEIPDPTEDEPDRLLTYEKAMTDGTYALNYFLAKGASLHNVGVAVDLTLEELSTGRELKMQTPMHDLSYHSILAKNNTNANLLSTIMKSAGFGGLISEWWHFQDNDNRNALNPAVLWPGISGKGWVRDDSGWRWRYTNGSFAADTTHTLDGVDYTFDSNGYVVE